MRAEIHWSYVVLLAVFSYACFGFVDGVMAQTLTDYSVTQGFQCINGSPSGNLLTAGDSCPDGPEDGKIFSYFICQFEAILNEVLSKVYCSVVGEATPTVLVALTLLIVLTGAAFLVGLTPFTAKELMILAAKFSLVFTFATQAEYMIGYGYTLFVAMAKEGIVIVLDYLFTTRSFDSGNDVYELFDQSLQDFITMATENEAESSGNKCQNSVFAMMVILAAAVPPLAFIGMYFVVRLLWMILRAVFGYCQGLLGLTFLVVLSPIYVSFALFKPTRTLFDKWVKYLISFGFQMVIVFAFIGMLFYILDQVADDFESYGELVQPYEQTAEQGPGIFNPVSGCGICEMDESSPKEKPACKEGGKVIPLDEMTKNEEFLEFATVKVLAMIILFYVLDIMIGFVPEMARHLAGPKYAGQLGGGGPHLRIPGEQAVGGALGAASQGFMRSSNSASGVVAGLSSGVSHALTAEGGMLDTAIRSVANPIDPNRDLSGGGNSPADNSLAGNLFGAAGLLTAGGAAIGAMVGQRGTPGAGSGGGSSGGGSGADDGPEQPTTPDTRSSNEQRQREQDQANHQLRSVNDPGLSGANAGLASVIENRLSTLPENASDQEIGVAISQAAGGAHPNEMLAAYRQIDLTRLPTSVSAYIRDKINNNIA